MSVRAGVVADGWLPHTARAMAYLIAQGTSREAEATEVLQLRALQLSDRWAPAVQRATRPLAKPVQIARGLVAAVARTAPVTRSQGARAVA